MLRDPALDVSLLLPFPDGKTLACSGNSVVALWDLESQKPRAILRPPFNMNLVWGLALTPDGKTLITGGYDRTVHLWDVTALQRDFPAPGWSLRGGKWKADGKELVQEALDEGVLLLFGDPKWTDYDLELEAMPTKGNGEVNAVVRAAGPGDFTAVILGGWTNTFHGIMPAVGGRFLANVAAPGKTVLDQWYKLKVEVRGKTCRLFLEGKLLATHTAVPAPSGQVGLRTVGTAARFRNIKVTDPAGKVLFEGLPTLPGARDK
jgi:hypothetical protein